MENKSKENNAIGIKKLMKEKCRIGSTMVKENNLMDILIKYYMKDNFLMENIQVMEYNIIIMKKSCMKGAIKMG